MKKRILATLLSLCLIIGLLPVTAMADELPQDELGRDVLPVTENEYYHNYIGNTDIAAKMSKDGTLTIYPTYSTTNDTVIPGIEDGYSGDNRAYPWYAAYGTDTNGRGGNHTQEIKNIIFADGITSIGGYLFNNLTSTDRLTGQLTVRIPDSVTQIGDTLFYTGNVGKDIVVGENVQSVGFWFGGSEAENVYLLNPDMIKLPKGDKYNLAFNSGYTVHVQGDSNSYELLNATPSPNFTIATHTAMGACGVATYSSEVWYIYDEDTKTLTILGSGAIKDFVSADKAPWAEFDVETVEVGAGITRIGDYAFASLRNITEESLNLDASVDVSASAFAIPGETSGIWNGYAWEVQGSTLKISVANVTSTDELGKEKTAIISTCRPWEEHKSQISTVEIGYGITGIGDDVFANMPLLSSVDLPSSLTSIGAGAFVGCPKLTELYIPKNVTTISETAFGTSSSEAKTMTIQVSPVAGDTLKGLTSQGKTIITVDYSKNLNVLMIGNSYFGELSAYLNTIAKGMGATDAMIANYYFGGDSGTLAAYVARIAAGEISYDSSAPYNGYKENGVRNESFNHNPLSMGIQAEDWDYVIVEAWGKNEPAGSNGDGKLSQDPNLKTLTDYIKLYAPQAEVDLYHVYSCQDLADSDPAETLEELWQRYADAADEGLTNIVSKVIPAGTLIQNARLTYLNADGKGFHRNPPTDIVHLNKEGDYMNALLMYRMLTGNSATGFDNSKFDDHREAFYQVLVDITLNAPSTKALTYATVTSNVTTSYYSTLSDAVSAAASGDTLTIIGMPRNEDKLTIAPGVTVLTYGSSKDHTIVLTKGGFVDEKGLTARAAYTLDGVEIVDGCTVTIDPVSGETTLGAHSLTKTDAKDATCTEDGVKAYWTCSVCGTYFSDETGTNKIADLDTWKTGEGKIAAAHTLSYVDEVPATYEADGVKAHQHCSVCGKNFINDVEKTDEELRIPKLTRPSGGSSTSNVITVENTKHGDVSLTPKSASGGTTVTITVEPDDGYKLDTLTVTDGSGNVLKLTDKGNGKYTFTMPSSGVSVKASFVLVNPFVDVSSGAYYYDAVLWASENGITSGVDDTHFAPDASCTRAQMVTFLWRAAGCPEPEDMSSFEDVEADAYYTKAVAWAVENGITGGVGNNKFAPDAVCTRAQMAAFLCRMADGKADSSVNFNDVSADAYYAEAVQWAAENGITVGTGDGTTFSPDEACTRGQMVTFLYRYFKG